MPTFTIPKNTTSVLQGKQVLYPTNASNKIMTVIDHIRSQAVRDPNKIAMIYHEEAITYRELLHRVNAVANSLLAQGIKKGDFIGCYDHRNINYFIGALAAFSLGAIYVPLEPFDTETKLESILSQLNNACVIVGNNLGADLRDKIHRVQTSVKNLKLFDYSHLIQGPSKEIDNPVTVDDMAYCLFTSGTTGQPKGVLVNHLPFLNHNLAKINDLNITHNDVVAQTTTQTFDVHIWQFIAPLMQGSTVVIIDRCQADAPKILLREIQKHNISVVQLVPSILGIVLDELEHTSSDQKLHQQLTSLRYMMATGEALPPQTCQRWFEYLEKNLPNKLIPIINAYGPTECGDDIGHMVLTKKLNNSAPVPIFNMPIQNTAIYILDDKMQPVENGAEGLLFVAGDCVGKGYLNNAQKTAEAFVEFTIDGKQCLLYNTGDRVKVSDGNVIYLGRISNSFVKLAGQRVELDSFTSALIKFPGVSQATSLEHKVGDQSRVVSYVTLKPDFLQQKQEEAAKVQAEQVAQIFDNTVTATTVSDEFNHNGWNNYNGKPFSDRAVRENLNDALSHINQYVTAESDVLEVGCGTGMLAVSIAPQCKSFTGVDISADSVAIAKRACRNYQNTEFSVCGADELTQTIKKRYDVVYFNAVVNYFGCPDKLTDVLSQAAKLLKPNGKLLVLDVYNNICKPALHTEFQLLQALLKKSDITVAQLKKNIDVKVQADPDLFLHPFYFKSLLTKIPELQSAQCFLKSGEKNDNGAPNPMVRYRYGVVLDTQPEQPFPHETKFLAWGKEIDSVGALIKWLQSNHADALLLSNVPNARTLEAQRLVTTLERSPTQDNIKQIYHSEFTSNKSVFSYAPNSIDPNQIAEQLAAYGYRIDNMLFSTDDPQLFDLCITKCSIKEVQHLPLRQSKQHDLSTRPIFTKVAQIVAPELMTTLRTHADYHQYCTVQIVPHLPLSTNGKIDAPLLLQKYPPHTADKPSEMFQDATTAIEINIAAIFKKSIEQYASVAGNISMKTEFADLGLSSIDLTKILAEINRVYQLELSLVQLKQLNSVAALSDQVATQIKAQEPSVSANLK